MSSTAPHFDHAAAQALIAELQDGIQVLRSKMGDRSAKSSGLRDHWKGGYADAYFQTDEPQFKSQTRRTIAQMQAMIRQVGAAAEQAAADQHAYELGHPAG